MARQVSVAQGIPREFELGGWDEPVPERLAAVLAPRFTVAADGRARRLRRTWLDTFDWRLHRAGLTLEHRVAAGVGELILTGPDEQQYSVPPDRLSWPAQAGALPPGRLRDRVRQVTGVRALLPTVRAGGDAQRLRVLNSDGKTVAWLAAEWLTVSQPTTAQLPGRLGLTAVRGYQGAAGRVGRSLAEAPGLTPADQPVLERALAAAGCQPGSYSGKIEVALTATMPARMAMARLLLALLDTLEANVAGTIADIDTEFLHDLRVATRRTRSALKLGEGVLPGGLAAACRDEFKWLGDATTPTRDLDVYLLSFARMTAGLAAAGPADLSPFHAYLARRRASERRRLVRALRSDRFAGLRSGWREALSELTPAPGGPTAAAFAAGRIARCYRRVLRDGRAITGSSPPERLHDLRKRCKELRYALEFFASLADPRTHPQVIRDLKGLQDCLGEYQDCQVQQHEITMFAGQLIRDRSVPAPALLAMGELAGLLATRAAQARADFAGRFAAFASTASRQRFRTLITGAAS